MNNSRAEASPTDGDGGVTVEPKLHQLMEMVV